MHFLTKVTPVLFLMLLADLALAVENWPQFRGPDGQGHAGDSAIATHWSETENIAWKSEIPGRGWSSPVIDGGKLWITTALDEGHSLHAVCLDAASGKIILDREVFKVEKPQTKHAKNSYASPTPILEARRVYVHFGAYGTACLEGATGEILWQNRDHWIEHEVGPGSSPALFKDLLIMTYDGTDKQYLAALDKQTGRLAWKRDRPPISAVKGPDQRKSFCTPLVVNAEGRDLVIATAADQAFANDPATGEPVWWVRYEGFSCAPRPIFGHGMAFICTGFSSQPQLWAIRPGGTGDVTESQVAWKLQKQAPTNPSPILVGERIYTVSDRGIATCLNVKTGAEIWKERLGGDFSASPIEAQGRIYFFNETGEATVIQSGDKYEQIARNKLGEGFMASPAVAGNALFVRTDTHVYRIENADRKPIQ